MSNHQTEQFNEHQHEMSIMKTLEALKATRQQSTYLSLDEICGVIKDAFPDEYKLIGEKLINYR